MKKFKSRKFYLLAIVLIAAILAGFTILKPGTATSDTARMDDLYTIELAVNKVIGSQKLPSSLGSLKLTNLHGELSDYEYKDYKLTHFGGDYTLCASFKNQGEKTTESYYTYEGLEAYKFHNKGKTCFKNSFYRDGSHITPLQ